jgi:hypothetical protein
MIIIGVDLRGMFSARIRAMDAVTSKRTEDKQSDHKNDVKVNC